MRIICGLHLTTILIISSLTVIGLCLPRFPSTYIDQTDVTRIKSATKLLSPISSNSVANIYYSLLTKSLLSETITDTNNEICNYLKTQISDQLLDSLFYASSAAKLLANCQIPSANLIQKLESYLKEESPVNDIYRASICLINFGRPIDSTKTSKALLASLKKDESLLNTGLAFQLAAKFTKVEDRNPFIEKIGDVIVQADEVDGSFLQFEGGLGITATIIIGVYQLATASNKPVGLTNDQALKFANYFLSRKFVLTPKGIAELLEVLNLYTNNKYHIPVVISNYGSIALSTANPVLTVRITNVLGKSLGALNMVGESATRVEDKKVIWTKKPFTGVQGDSTLFAINFLESKPIRGFYDVAITATPTKADPRLIGNVGINVRAIVLTQVSIVSADISVADRDSGGSGAVTKLEYPSKLTFQLEADYQQKLLIKFQLSDKIAGDLLTAHQTFVQLLNTETKQEIVFVAEPDSTLTYKMDINLQSKAKDLNYISGVYQISLIIGDAVISNPINWNIGNINLQLPANPNPSSGEDSVSLYAVKPEINHLFRQQEKRPPPVVSNAFSILAFIPILILFVLWIKIGVNLSLFPFKLSALVFHTGLASIFLLYTCFFIKLDMFQTCKYLAGIGVITFLSGHTVLSRLANAKNKT